jgi:hypothetical protein
MNTKIITRLIILTLSFSLILLPSIGQDVEEPPVNSKIIAGVGIFLPVNNEVGLNIDLEFQTELANQMYFGFRVSRMSEIVIAFGNSPTVNATYILVTSGFDLSRIYGEKIAGNIGIGVGYGTGTYRGKYLGNNSGGFFSLGDSWEEEVFSQLSASFDFRLGYKTKRGAIGFSMLSYFNSETVNTNCGLYFQLDIK